MDPWLFATVLVWQVALVGVLAAWALHAKTFVERVLALEAMAFVLVAALASVALREERAGYLDVALVLAALGFTQTVATARLLHDRFERRGT